MGRQRGQLKYTGSFLLRMRCSSIPWITAQRRTTHGSTVFDGAGFSPGPCDRARTLRAARAAALLGESAPLRRPPFWQGLAYLGRLAIGVPNIIIWFFAFDHPTGTPGDGSYGPGHVPPLLVLP